MTAPVQHSGQDLGALLAFYAEAGVDEPLGDAPVDRFAEAQPRQTPRKPAGAAAQQPAPQAAPTQPIPVMRPTAAQAAVPDGAQAALARQLAAGAATLEELREAMAAFDGCNLKSTAKSLVFADGNPTAALMLVGEAPGRDEDIEGRPFVGRSGQLLDRMLAAIGIDRESAYIANVIPWRPPGNRAPTPHETEICRPFIERQIELVNPKVLINLGGPSAKTLLHATDGILRLRGNWSTHTTASGIAIPTMPTLHPAYLLRTPAHKKLAWRDFVEVKVKLHALQG